ncbi:MAG: hypothetical protein ACKO23_02880 [Gemmataceae bacterium]
MPRSQRASPGTLNDDQVARWADRIAEGRDDFPEALTPGDRQRLLAAVRKRHHDRLVGLIARAIAWQLHRQRSP